jgi:hypothetical protein
MFRDPYVIMNDRVGRPIPIDHDGDRKQSESGYELHLLRMASHDDQFRIAPIG